MILLIDNHDSFVYNLARYIEELGFQSLVKRNNQITLADIELLSPSHIIISPGPCAPEQAGISMEIVRYFSGKIPILGVCLGHQVIGQVFGGKVVRAKRPMHGKSSFIFHDEKKIFTGLKNPLQVGRYHSLIVDEKTLSHELEVIARCEIGEVMALAHRDFSVVGVQFHPESILTNQGHELLRNFIKIYSYLNPNR